MKKFCIDFAFDVCSLKVADHSCHNPDDCVIDFVTYVKDGIEIVSNKSKSIREYCNGHDYEYVPEEDGKYRYYRLVLPSYNSFDGCGHHLDIPGGYFVAEDINGDKIICKKEGNFVSLENSGDGQTVIIVDDLLKIVDELPFDMIYSKEFFSICKILTCVAKLQKKYILDHINDCGSIKCKNGSDKDKAHRDFLFVSSYVLKHLVETGELDMAEEILNRLKSCNSICDDKTNINCNCNG